MRDECYKARYILLLKMIEAMNCHTISDTEFAMKSLKTLAAQLMEEHLNE